MRRAVIAVSLVLLVTLVLVGTALAGGRPINGGTPLTANLTGAVEVPGPGDPDGAGTAWISLNQGQGEVCFNIEYTGLVDVRAAHIHPGAAGVAGPPLVPFALDSDPSTGISGCTAAPADVIKAIRQNPADYYVNVHTAEFGPGAIRGQLQGPGQ